MKISRKTDYALRALVAMADLPSGELISIRKLAEDHDIPRRFLEQIMLDLRKLGWVRAVTGRDGGYALTANPDELTMGQIVRHFDGILAPISCVSVTGYEPCTQEPHCRFRRVFLEARNHVAHILDQLTLTDLATGVPVSSTEVREVACDNGAGI